MNAGRSCWVVVGTFNHREKRDGKFVDKEEGCMKCDFYLKVREEEGMGFKLAANLKPMYEGKSS